MKAYWYYRYPDSPMGEGELTINRPALSALRKDLLSSYSPKGLTAEWPMPPKATISSARLFPLHGPLLHRGPIQGLSFSRDTGDN